MFPVEERVDTLESILGQFIVHTDTALRRLEREMQAFKEEMRAFKDRTEQMLKEQNRRWGELANRMGTIVEDIVAPNIPRIAKEYFGCEDIDFFAVRIEKRDKKRNITREFDVIAICNGKVILNETKSTPRQSYVDEFVDFIKAGEFFEYFPEYKGMDLIPIFSSLYLSEAIVRRLTRSKIYAMAMKDDTMDILNPNLNPINAINAINTKNIKE